MAIDAFTVDAASGLPDFVLSSSVDPARGRMAVEPYGRCVYFAPAGGSDPAAFTIEAQTGAA